MHTTNPRILTPQVVKRDSSVRAYDHPAESTQNRRRNAIRQTLSSKVEALCGKMIRIQKKNSLLVPFLSWQTAITQILLLAFAFSTSISASSFSFSGLKLGSTRATLHLLDQLITSCFFLSGRSCVTSPDAREECSRSPRFLFITDRGDWGER